MPGRRGFGDESWRLAQAGDGAGLHRAADLLLEGDTGDLRYDGHRARAFALALEGRVEDALAALNAGWTRDWPFPSAFAADTARVRLLADDPERALQALALATRGADRLDPGVPELLAEVALRAPRLRGRVLRVALGGGTLRLRLRLALAALRRRA
ncbi:MAG TPA: hypothetical protein VF186_03260 [Gaiellaceae bacterium]